MKVLQILKTAEGASWAFRQIRELASLGTDIIVVLPEGKMVEEYRKLGVITVVADLSLTLNIFHFYKRCRKLKKILKDYNPDIIHSHFFSTTILMRLCLRFDQTRKRIFQVPGPLHLEHFIFRYIDLLTSTNQDYWVASCKWTYDKYAQLHVDHSRLGLVYYGVDVEEHVTRTRECILRKEYNIPFDAFVVGTVSYFYKPKKYLFQKRGLKGHEDLIDAFSQFNKLHPNSYCIIVGGPWGDSQHYMNEVKNYAELKGCKNIIFTGFRNDVQSIYPDFDIACHPSHSENIGGAVESMLCSVPTMTSNVGGFPDIVIDGKTGWLFESKNPNSLLECLENVYSLDDRSAYAIKGKLLATNLLNVQVNAKDLHGFYRRILSR
ncbi:hypothetical protein BCT06_13690 [Vibrio breoganii]|uniref:glycosyltransferase n=1 Tax=Vibrio breoganii TaxID=553239 RepID=UPI000C82E9AA|nr:glycosyltransferase [Vibrio breoganii]PMO59958.1 hypothetical protein BCT06_13690 [Vibrio breoganii]